MCGRYNLVDDPATRALLKELDIDVGIHGRVNIAPTEHAPVIVNGGSGHVLEEMRWWLVPSWASKPDSRYAMFNARAETVHESRAFREPFRKRRALVPASSFIEWQRSGERKLPLLIRAHDAALTFAGIWERWEHGGRVLHSFAIITTDAAPQFRDIHARMPVMLPAPAWETWLDPDAEAESLLGLLRPCLAQDLEVCPVSEKINNARNKDPAALEPAGAVRHIAAAQAG